MFGIEQHIVVLLLSVGGVEQPPEVSQPSPSTFEHQMGVVETLEEMAGEGGALEEVFDTSLDFPTELQDGARFNEPESSCCDLKGDDDLSSRREDAPFGEFQELGSVRAVPGVVHRAKLPQTR